MFMNTSYIINRIRMKAVCLFLFFLWAVLYNGKIGVPYKCSMTGLKSLPTTYYFGKKYLSYGINSWNDWGWWVDHLNVLDEIWALSSKPTDLENWLYGILLVFDVSAFIIIFNFYWFVIDKNIFVLIALNKSIIHIRAQENYSPLIPRPNFFYPDGLQSQKKIKKLVIQTFK